MLNFVPHAPNRKYKGDCLSKAGDTIENPATGERIVVRVGTEDSGGELLAVDTFVRPGGAVTGEDLHPAIEESFTVVRGRIGFRVGGRESVAEPNPRMHVPAGTAHDWWNAGEDEAHIVVEIRPGERFEKMALNLFGLAQDGKTNAKGMPNLLQGASFAREFSDVLYFTRPPLWVQRVLFGALATVARALGYGGSYPKYSDAPEPSSEGAGPPSTTRVATGTFAVAASLLLAFSSCAEEHAASRPRHHPTRTDKLQATLDDNHARKGLIRTPCGGSTLFADV